MAPGSQLQLTSNLFSSALCILGTRDPVKLAMQRERGGGGRGRGRGEDAEKGGFAAQYEL